jgi:hypothetical protein
MNRISIVSSHERAPTGSSGTGAQATLALDERCNACSSLTRREVWDSAQNMGMSASAMANSPPDQPKVFLRSENASFS